MLRLTEDRTDRDALTEEALSLLDGASDRLRADDPRAEAEYLADADRRDEAATVVQQVMDEVGRDRGRLYAELMSVVARLSAHDGDPAESLRRLADLVARSDSVPDVPAIRAMHTIGSAHYRQENLEAALSGYRVCFERAVAAGLPWTPYATDSRAMAVTVSYELGRWDLALRLADADDEHPPDFALAALQCGVVLRPCRPRERPPCRAVPPDPSAVAARRDVPRPVRRGDDRHPRVCR